MNYEVGKFYKVRCIELLNSNDEVFAVVPIIGEMHRDPQFGADKPHYGFKASKGQKQSSLTKQFQIGKAFQLNSRFVGEMMGFPVDWCELPFLHGKDVDLLASDKQKPDSEEKQLKPTAMP